MLNNNTVITNGLDNITFQVKLDNTNQVVGLPFFLQNSVLFDLNGQAIGYTSNFVTDQAIDTSATPLNVTSASVPLGLAGVISGRRRHHRKRRLSDVERSQHLHRSNGRQRGRAVVLAGPGSIAISPVTVDGLFDISNTYSGAAIPSLSVVAPYFWDPMRS